MPHATETKMRGLSARVATKSLGGHFVVYFFVAVAAFLRT
jgi:hypothetical protein